MRQRFHLLLVLVAWLMATGSHWDIMQTVAWTKMTISYASDMSLIEAVKETFDPENMCDMCRVVRDAKEKETDNANAGAKLDGKILLLLPALRAIVTDVLPACTYAWSQVRLPESQRASPLLTPPREMAA